MKIDAGKVYIRKIKIIDAKDIFEYAQDEDTGPRAGWAPHENIETTEKIIKEWLKLKSYEFNYAIVYKENNKVIGTIGVVNINEKEKDEKNIYLKSLVNKGKVVYEIGTTISKAYWGKGVATNTLKAIIDNIFTTTNADFIATCHYSENIGSKIVQDKVNMKILGSYKKDKKWYNTNCTTMIVRGKTREEWQIEKNNT